MNSPLLISNRDARRIFLDRQGLTRPPGQRQNRRQLAALIRELGFVQLDSIRTLERAHHMILFARNNSYRPRHLRKLLEQDAAIFENWTHDAAVIPTDFYPFWMRRFEREKPAILARWRKWRREGFEEQLEDLLGAIRERGPVMARELGNDETKNAGGWWDWHPSKTALEFLWRCGDLAVVRREGFQKVYDLTERVIPSVHRAEAATTAEMIDWSCENALQRLGFATPAELAAFWGNVNLAEARSWCQSKIGKGLIEVKVEDADRKSSKSYFAREDFAESVTSTSTPPGRLRALSPFDPAIRDRARTKHLFGFDYRIEVFVPAHKRRYGYYVFPLLEEDRLIGRIDMTCKGGSNCLQVTALWLEPRYKLTGNRKAKLEKELARLCAFAEAEVVDYEKNWLAAP